jgi:hypothetical protein
VVRLKHDMIGRKRGPHAADIIAVVGGQADMKRFRQEFGIQFSADAALGLRVLRILDGYFRTSTSPGFLVYEEQLVGDKPLDHAARTEVADELARAERLMLGLLPPTRFFQLLAGIEDCCDLERSAPLVEEFLLNLDRSGISIYSQDALQFIPAVVFGGAFSRGDNFVVTTGEVLAQLTKAELSLARHHFLASAEKLAGNEELTKRFVRAFHRAG